MPGIDKVRLDNSYQQYQQRTPVKSTGESKIQFPFDPDEKGVIYERTDPQKKDAVQTVRVEVAKNMETEPAAKAKPAEEQDAAATGSVTGWLAGLGRRFLTFLRGIWDVVWNGPDQGAKTENREAAEEESPLSEEGALSSDGVDVGDVPDSTQSSEFLQQIIANRDMEQLVQYVTEGGTKKPARSTDLLTIYNRYGRVNAVDPSDRRKILEGNFNDIKL